MLGDDGQQVILQDMPRPQLLADVPSVVLVAQIPDQVFYALYDTDSEEDVSITAWDDQAQAPS